MLWRVLRFPGNLGSHARRGLRDQVLRELRISGSCLILDLSDRQTLSHDDIELLLECAAYVACRDAKLIFVAESPALRAILEVCRLSSVVPVCDSADEARSWPPVAHVQVDLKGNGERQ
jgi:anti-anti-sigma regulatory factor